MEKAQEEIQEGSPKKTNPMAASYDLYAGQKLEDALGLLETVDHGVLSLWDGAAGRPRQVFMHYVVQPAPVETAPVEPTPVDPAPVQPTAPQILGHLAKKNPVLKMLDAAPQATFWVDGPSAYVPSHWYQVDPERAVPTSYYSWAQFEVEVSLLRGREENVAMLEKMLARFQPEGQHPPMDLADRFWQGMTGAITGLKMTIRESQSRHKYGQNRPASTRGHIADQLRKRASGQDSEVAEQVLARLEQGVQG